MSSPPAPTRNDTALLPLTLRKEAFGGILFDPADGTFLDLDTEGYAFARDWLRRERQPRTDDEQAFLAHLKQEVESVASGPRACRVVELPAPGARFRHATVLTAPSLVDLQVTRKCNMGCPHCYASARADGPHMPFEDVVRILDQLAAAGVCQVAIGGGEPLLHPQILTIMERIHVLGMVPSMTTTGDGLTPALLDVMARRCGAVALSLEGVGAAYEERRRLGWDFFRDVLARLFAGGVRTVLQVTLSAENFAALPQIVEFCATQPQLYGVIFLAYKSVGRGDGYNRPLWDLPISTVFPPLRNAFLQLSEMTRVGYDCCLTPGITGIERDFGFRELDLLEGCSAARSSMGITPELDAVPCTFATHKPLGNLGTHSLVEVWQGAAAHAFRNQIDMRADQDPACQACASRKGCLGGCPEWDLVHCHGKPG